MVDELIMKVTTRLPHIVCKASSRRYGVRAKRGLVDVIATNAGMQPLRASRIALTPDDAIELGTLLITAAGMAKLEATRHATPDGANPPELAVVRR